MRNLMKRACCGAARALMMVVPVDVTAAIRALPHLPRADSPKGLWTPAPATAKIHRILKSAHDGIREVES